MKMIKHHDDLSRRSGVSTSVMQRKPTLTTLNLRPRFSQRRRIPRFFSGESTGVRLDEELNDFYRALTKDGRVEWDGT